MCHKIKKAFRHYNKILNTVKVFCYPQELLCFAFRETHRKRILIDTMEIQVYQWIKEFSRALGKKTGLTKIVNKRSRFVTWY